MSIQLAMADPASNLPQIRQFPLPPTRNDDY